MFIPTKKIGGSENLQTFNNYLEEITQRLTKVFPVSSYNYGLNYQFHYRGAATKPLRNLFQFYGHILSIMQPSQSAHDRIIDFTIKTNTYFPESIVMFNDYPRPRKNQYPIKLEIILHTNNVEYPITGMTPTIRFCDDYKDENIVELTGGNAVLTANPQHVVRVFAVDNHISVHTNAVTWEMIYFLIAMSVSKVVSLDQHTLKNLGNYKVLYNLIEALGKRNYEWVENAMQEFLNNDHTMDSLAYIIREYYFQGDAKRENILIKKIEELERTKTEYLVNLESMETSQRSFIDELTSLRVRSFQSPDIGSPTAKTIMQNKDIKYIVPLDQRMSSKINGNSFPIGESLALFMQAPLTDFNESQFLQGKAYYLDGFEADTRSWLYKCIEKFSNDCFLKQKYRIWVHAVIAINTRTFNTTSVTNQLSTDPYYDTSIYPPRDAWEKYLYHPHIVGANCWGNHKAQILDWLKAPNPAGVFTQLSLVVRNINMSDSGVVRALFRNLKTHFDSPKCIEDVESGEMMTLAKYCALNLPELFTPDLRPRNTADLWDAVAQYVREDEPHEDFEIFD
jgi:hypothetical protein